MNLLPAGLAALLVSGVAVPVLALSGGSADAAACYVASPPPSPIPPVASGPPVSPSPSPSATATATATAPASPQPAPPDCANGVQLTLEDDGATVQIPVGQDLRVSLPGAWTAPAAADRTPLFRTGLRAYASRTDAVFEVLTRGRTVVSATEDSYCDQDFDCPLRPVRTWSVTVEAVGADPAPKPTPTAWPCAQPAYSMPYGTTFLGERDAGTTVTVAQGDTVFIGFYGDCSSHLRRAPAQAHLLERTSAEEALSGTTAFFRARRVGEQVLTADDDDRCFHGATPCARPVSRWTATVRVVARPSCDPRALLNAPATVAWGSTVTVGGGTSSTATVTVGFQRNGAFQVRRRVNPVAGRWSTTYRALQDERLQAATLACRSADRVVKVRAVTQGPAAVPRGSRVVLTVRGQANVPVVLLFRGRGQTGFTLRRSGRTDDAGRFTTSYVATSDQRYYARTGAGRDGVWGLTQVR